MDRSTSCQQTLEPMEHAFSALALLGRVPSPLAWAGMARAVGAQGSAGAPAGETRLEMSKLQGRVP